VKIISLLLTSLLVTTAPHIAQAKLTKYWVLKISFGYSPSYYAFKSPRACEDAKKKYLKDMATINARFKGQKGVLQQKFTAKCLNHIPLGYDRPRN
jgi:hypothetical protein